MTEDSPNVNYDEIKKFSGIAEKWWDLKGPFRGLHDMNPVRVAYIKSRCDINGSSILDIGCGGGILCEALSQLGADVTGIDMNESALEVAREHMRISGLDINYQEISAELYALENRGKFDIVTSMEVLEHIPRPDSVIQSCYELLKPGGHLFVSTINRTWQSFLLAIVASEYICNIMEKKTHTFKKFIRPLEMKQWAMEAGFSYGGISGILYIPYFPICRLWRNTRVNYIMHFIRLE